MKIVSLRQPGKRGGRSFVKHYIQVKVDGIDFGYQLRVKKKRHPGHETITPHAQRAFGRQDGFETAERSF
jgi:hypothetical protein